MRFLIDRCAGRRLADWLRQRGYDVLESRARGADPGDRTLLMWADSEQRVLVTMDKDFGKLIFSSGEAHSGVVRLPDVPAEERIALCSSPSMRKTSRPAPEESAPPQRRKQLKILDLFGQIDYDPDHDYKEQRRRE